MHKRHVAHTALKPSRNRSLGPRKATGLGGSALCHGRQGSAHCCEAGLCVALASPAAEPGCAIARPKKLASLHFLKTTTTTSSTSTSSPSPVLATPHNKSKCLADVCAPPLPLPLVSVPRYFPPTAQANSDCAPSQSNPPSSPPRRFAPARSRPPLPSSWLSRVL